MQKIQAWFVHVFTSLGLISAFMALISVEHQDWRASFLWLVLCFIIDSVDGTLARLFKVEEVLPYMDGKMIDFVIDFMSYAVVPAFFFYKAQMVEEKFMPMAIFVILISSALYYGKRGMVKDDEYFVGFPVLWNFVVFYQFFIFDNHQWLNLLTVIFFGLIHFVPLKFAYPSRAKKYFWGHLIISIFGMIGALFVLLNYPSENDIGREWGRWATIIGAVYFSIFCLFDTYRLK